jgi:hypothetical protein
LSCLFNEEKETRPLKKNVSGQRSAMSYSEKVAQRQRTPWFIVTSLKGGAEITKRVINFYKTPCKLKKVFEI